MNKTLAVLLETLARAGSLAVIWAVLAALFESHDPYTVGLSSFGACALGFWAGRRGW